jgi:hypothetical protein
MALLTVALALLLLGHASAFTSVGNVKYSFKMSSVGSHRTSNLCCSVSVKQMYQCIHSSVPIKLRRTALSMCTDSSDKEKVDEIDMIKIFGRMAEKTLFGDGSAGQCCHSGCPDCEWRYSFDILQSARPKWIPTYRFDCLKCCHTALRLTLTLHAQCLQV